MRSCFKIREMLLVVDLLWLSVSFSVVTCLLQFQVFQRSLFITRPQSPLQMSSHPQLVGCNPKVGHRSVFSGPHAFSWETKCWGKYHSNCSVSFMVNAWMSEKNDPTVVPPDTVAAKWSDLNLMWDLFLLSKACYILLKWTWDGARITADTWRVNISNDDDRQKKPDYRNIH